MVGKVLYGYDIIEFKGKGSFGTVYKCKKNNQSYAMKIFSMDYVFTEFAKSDDNRITREIAALKTVNSPYVAGYIDDGSYEDNGWTYLYVVMDFIEGEDLSQVLKRRDLSQEEIIEIFSQIVKGIAAIHLARLVHRDLKPANIYLLKNGSIKILDFGLSKLIDFTSITNTGDQLGSPLYMSPEQISDSKNIDYRSDYYALGVILFELFTKQNPYGIVTSREELYYKIKMEPPLSIRLFIPTIVNAIDNLIIKLLQKENYKRPNSVDEIFEYLNSIDESKELKEVSFVPSHYLRLWNEKTVFEEYYADGYKVENIIFPINHQSRQKNLLNFVRANKINTIIDPATMRLAYDSYADVKGLVALPYAPSDYNRLELDDLKEYESKREYVKKVVDEQLKYKSMNVVAPFHVSNNSNLQKIKMDTNENWFSLDVKLLEETRTYLNSIDYEGKLIGGFCIKCDILTNRSEKEYFLNVLSGLSCDIYWVYVDCIDNNSNAAQLYNYANTLLELQNSTKKPIIAGRIGSFGLVLLAFGLYAFESGASRFESFYEDLYKDTSDPYNLYVRYYMPELLNNVAIERKNPIKIIQLLESKVGVNIACHCPYCEGINPALLANDALSKKHFLYRRNEEIKKLRSLSEISDRVEHLEMMINDAITYYKNLKPIFKDDDYKFLKTWLEVIEKLKEKWM